MIRRLYGALTVERAAELKAELAARDGNDGDLTLDLSEVKEFDFSLIQLLHSARKTYLNKGGTFAIVGKVPPPVGRAMELCGLTVQA